MVVSGRRSSRTRPAARCRAARRRGWCRAALLDKGCLYASSPLCPPPAPRRTSSGISAGAPAPPPSRRVVVGGRRTCPMRWPRDANASGDARAGLDVRGSEGRGRSSKERWEQEHENRRTRHPRDTAMRTAPPSTSGVLSRSRNGGIGILPVPPTGRTRDARSQARTGLHAHGYWSSFLTGRAIRRGEWTGLSRRLRLRWARHDRRAVDDRRHRARAVRDRPLRAVRSRRRRSLAVDERSSRANA